MDLVEWMLSGAPPPSKPLGGKGAAPPDPEGPPPLNIEAEQQLLGAIMANNEIFHSVSDLVAERDFFDPVHGRLFEAFSRRIHGGRAVDPVTLKEMVESDEGLRDLGGQRYLINLMKGAVSISLAPEYARTISSLAQKRRLMEAGAELADRARAGADEGAESLLALAESRLAEIAGEDRTGRGFTSFLKAATESVTAANDAYKRGGGLAGLSTGLADLDKALGGLQDSDLVILAGRPAMGKTALAVNIAFAVAAAGHPVAFFSLEMSAAQLASRVLASRAGVAGEDLRRGTGGQDGVRAVVGAARHLEGLPLFIDDGGGKTFGEIAAGARRLQRRHGMAALFVDYLQLMQPPQGSRSRVEEVGDMTRSLKMLAKDLNVPVVALSQLSRAVESRTNKRPLLSDLRDSGAIEQDADVVMFVYREEYYLAQNEPDPSDEGWVEWERGIAAARGKAEVIIGKHRHAPTGTARLHFDAALSQFSDPAGEQWTSAPDRDEYRDPTGGDATEGDF